MGKLHHTQRRGHYCEASRLVWRVLGLNHISRLPLRRVLGPKRRSPLRGCARCRRENQPARSDTVWGTTLPSEESLRFFAPSRPLYHVCYSRGPALYP